MKKIEKPKTIEDVMYNATIIMDKMNENFMRIVMKVQSLENRIIILEAKK